MSHPPVLTLHRNGAPVQPTEHAFRELMAVREIVRAFLTAERPEDVFGVALERVTPIVGAAFSSVFLVDGESDLMRLAAAHNWPERYRPWLGEMRVKLGSGPSGEAVRERRAVEVPDVFAEPHLADWQDVARELGVRALVALPLQTGATTLGAVTFYFTQPGGFSTEARSLLRIVADQMAATAEKAGLITELRRANTALLETNSELERQYVAVLEARQVKDEFLANVSHELRTPLTSVMGYVSLLQEGISGPLTKEQSDDLEQVQSSSDRLLSLIDDLLDLTTLKRGATRARFEEFDTRDVVAEALVEAPPVPPGITLRTELPDTLLPPMRSDRKKVVKVLISLLRNAYKFTVKGEVSVAVDVRGGWVAYHVRDTGIGIPADAQELIFEEFRQADGSATRQYGGSGLGLALGRRLARLLGGDIQLASAPGVGSTFTLALPLDAEAIVGSDARGVTTFST